MPTCRFCGRKNCAMDANGLCRTCSLEHAAHCDGASDIGADGFFTGVIAAGIIIIAYLVIEALL